MAPVSSGTGSFSVSTRCCSTARWATGSVVRHNSVVEGCRVPPGFHIPSATNIHNDDDLARIEPVPVDMTAFSEDVARTNVDLVKGYKRLANEF